MKCDHDNCFTCPYPDCVLPDDDIKNELKVLRAKELARKKYQHDYQKIYRKEKAQEIRAKQRQYAEANRYEIDIKRRIRCIKDSIKKKSICYYCKAQNNEPHDIYKYRKHYFCSFDCLGKYLLDRAEKEVVKSWVDTKIDVEKVAREEKEKWDRDATTC